MVTPGIPTSVGCWMPSLLQSQKTVPSMDVPWFTVSGSRSLVAITPFQEPLPMNCAWYVKLPACNGGVEVELGTDPLLPTCTVSVLLSAPVLMSTKVYVTVPVGAVEPKPESVAVSYTDVPSGTGPLTAAPSAAWIVVVISGGAGAGTERGSTALWEPA